VGGETNLQKTIRENREPNIPKKSKRGRERERACVWCQRKSLAGGTEGTA